MLKDPRKTLADAWPCGRAVCTCTHTGDGPDSEHEDNLEAGHGACKEPGCDCKHFTWAGWTQEFSDALGHVTAAPTTVPVIR